jgi:predicted PurR-regulated permease PerM
MWIVLLLSLSAVVITVLLYVVISRRHHLAIALSKMEDMNQQLHTVVDQKNAIEGQLKQNNVQLKEEIDYRNSNFIDVYKLVSEYISDVKNFRKSIFNLITAGKVNKVKSGGNWLLTMLRTNIFTGFMYSLTKPFFLLIRIF